MQKKLKISIKDFIEINDLYGPTKIEIIPIKNVYGKFINIKGNQKNLYHIYYNDTKIETKNKYHESFSNVPSNDFKSWYDYNL